MTAQAQQANDYDYDDDHTPLDDVGILTENVMKLVEHPEDVFVEESLSNLGTVLRIHVREDDRGRVIGTKGANINLLRDLMGIFAARQRKRLILEVAGTKPRGRRERKRAHV